MSKASGKKNPKPKPDQKRKSPGWGIDQTKYDKARADKPIRPKPI